MERCILEGYEIQPKTVVYINTWAIASDPEYWENPHEFLPERFFNSDIDVKGQDFEVIPFGSGRRMCPGMFMGLTNVELTVANLLYSFDWELPTGIREEDVDTDVLPGIAMHKKNPLLLEIPMDLDMQPNGTELDNPPPLNLEEFPPFQSKSGPSTPIHEHQNTHTEPQPFFHPKSFTEIVTKATTQTTNSVLFEHTSPIGSVIVQDNKEILCFSNSELDLLAKKWELALVGCAHTGHDLSQCYIVGNAPRPVKAPIPNPSPGKDKSSEVPSPSQNITHSSPQVVETESGQHTTPPHKTLTHVVSPDLIPSHDTLTQVSVDQHTSKLPTPQEIRRQRTGKQPMVDIPMEVDIATLSNSFSILQPLEDREHPPINSESSSGLLPPDTVQEEQGTRKQLALHKRGISRIGSNTNRHLDLEEFGQMVSDSGIIDIGYEGDNMHTWSRCGLQERLDRIFINHTWADNFPKSSVQHLPRANSDHAPLFFQDSLSTHKPHVSFRYMNMWARYHSFLPTIQQTWDSPTSLSGLLNLQCKLLRVKNKLIWWNKNIFGNIFDKVSQAHDQVASAERAYDSNPSPTLLIELNHAKAALTLATKIEEEFWHQNPLANGLLKGI
ncbi:hypothetical protein DH2020_004956 [Rehmannia glutinosa]|uniref:Uncharacterized protein n=1 Tax=Rehmannia glutinosa TaxID=99300 RepID=A0ABR0XQU4_REHGL